MSDCIFAEQNSNNQTMTTGNSDMHSGTIKTEIRSLRDIEPEKVIDAFEEAFSDYAVSFDRREIKAMLVRRGFCRDLSFAAFDGDRIAAFTLNGIGVYDGDKTAYDCATGTIASYRGRGLAAAIFRHSLPELRRAGVSRYLLEVLQTNTPAIAVYRKNGFGICAEYDCYNQSISALNLDRPYPEEIGIRPAGIGEVEKMADAADFMPSWQNSLESVSRGIEGLLVKGAYAGERCVGCCVADPLTGDITQIAVDSGWRRRGIGSALMKAVSEDMKSDRVKVLNIDTQCRSMSGFLKAINMAEGLKQFAMSREI